MTPTPLPSGPRDVGCPVCDMPATEVVDDDGDAFATCHFCGQVYVTPSYADGPTLTYTTPELQADLDRMRAETREAPTPLPCMVCQGVGWLPEGSTCLACQGRQRRERERS